MNAFGEVLTAVLEDRGVSGEELKRQAPRVGETLRMDMTADDEERFTRPGVITDLARALDLTAEEKARIIDAYFYGEER